jgi:hypothetical protein
MSVLSGGSGALHGFAGFSGSQLLIMSLSSAEWCTFCCTFCCLIYAIITYPECCPPQLYEYKED